MIDKIKEANKKLNAVVSYVEHEVQVGGPLTGWTIALKDNINMKNTLTTASSKMLADYKSIYSATLVDKLIEAGGRIVAKTSLDELGMGGTNLIASTGPVINPYCDTCISGGSSGGSAALAGANLVRLAIGSDTGDSVRKPASFCGVVGVKPTYGRISRYGVIPYAASLDTVGYFTQNVKDAAVALEVLAGRDDKDMTSSFEPVQHYSQHLDMNLDGVNIGVFKNVVDSVDEDVKLLFNNLLETLKKQGANIIEKEMDQALVRVMLPTYMVIANVEAATHHANLDGVRIGKPQDTQSLEELMVQTRTNGFSDQVKERFIYGQYSVDGDHKVSVYAKAKKVRRLLVDAYKDMMDGVDVMLVPAAPGGATPLNQPKTDITTDRFLIADNHMVINNFSGFPSMTLPLGKVESLPVGINISCGPFEEAKMFAIGQSLETLIDWKGDF